MSWLIIQPISYEPYLNIYVRELKPDLGNHGFVTGSIQQSVYIIRIINSHFNHPAFAVRVIIYQLRCVGKCGIELGNGTAHRKKQIRYCFYRFYRSKYITGGQRLANALNFYINNITQLALSKSVMPIVATLPSMLIHSWSLV